MMPLWRVAFPDPQDLTTPICLLPHPNVLPSLASLRAVVAGTESLELRVQVSQGSYHPPPPLVFEA